MSKEESALIFDMQVGSDPMLACIASIVDRLHRRVRDLEREVSQLKASRDISELRHEVRQDIERISARVASSESGKALTSL